MDLTKELNDVFGNNGHNKIPNREVAIQVVSDTNIIVYLDGKQIKEIRGGSSAIILCPIGNHQFRFVATSFSSIQQFLDIDAREGVKIEPILISFAGKLKKEQRKEDKKFLREYSRGKYSYYDCNKKQRELIDDPSNWYYVNKYEVFTIVSVVIFILMFALLIVSLIVFVIGWYKGTGHARVWNYVAVCSLILGVIFMITSLVCDEKT